jgi:hypothetical protein
MQKARLRNFFQNFLFLFNYHRPSKRPNVLIFSLPRSGSTWLQELIWSQSGFKYANEPLNIKGIFLQKKSKIRGFSELYTEEVKPKVITYFKKITEGKIHVLDPSPLRKNTRFFTNRVVFKVIHGGELFINDIAKATNSKIVYLLRNPIAVSLSRKQLPRTKELTSELVLSTFTSEEKEVVSAIMENGDSMEKRILMWCIQNRLALHQRTKDWLVISYESLTVEPEKVIDKLAKHCELSDPEKMINSVNIPSAVTIQSEKDSVNLMQNTSDKRQELISKWRSKVSEADAKKYFEICKKMNIDIYNFESDLPKADFFGISI